MKQRDRELWRLALRATSLGWELAVPIFGGVVVGYLVDRLLGTSYIFTLALLGLGVIAGFYNVIRSIQHVDEQSRRRGVRDAGVRDGEERESDR